MNWKTPQEIIITWSVIPVNAKMFIKCILVLSPDRDILNITFHFDMPAFYRLCKIEVNNIGFWTLMNCLADDKVFSRAEIFLQTV